MTRGEIEEAYAISRRIEAEERWALGGPAGSAARASPRTPWGCACQQCCPTPRAATLSAYQHHRLSTHPDLLPCLQPAGAWTTR